MQNKILRANHELQTFHEMLADVLWLSSRYLHNSLLLFTVHRSWVMRQASNRHRDAIWRFSHRRPMAAFGYRVWTNSCELTSCFNGHINLWFACRFPSSGVHVFPQMPTTKSFNSVLHESKELKLIRMYRQTVRLMIGKLWPRPRSKARTH